MTGFAKFFSALAVTCMVTVGGCSSVPSQDPEGEKRAIAWNQINRLTEVAELGSNRLRVTANASVGYSIEALEGDLLARAAGEAVRRGATRFSIVYLDYADNGVGTWFGQPSYNDATRRWIGTYEAILRARSEADASGKLNGALKPKRITAVIRMLGVNEDLDRDAFNAEETYVALLYDRIGRRNIRPATRSQFRFTSPALR